MPDAPLPPQPAFTGWLPTVEKCPRCRSVMSGKFPHSFAYIEALQCSRCSTTIQLGLTLKCAKETHYNPPEETQHDTSEAQTVTNPPPHYYHPASTVWMCRPCARVVSVLDSNQGFYVQTQPCPNCHHQPNL